MHTPEFAMKVFDVERTALLMSFVLRFYLIVVVENMNMFHLPCHRKESQDRDQAE
jgi:hypothetical protein